MKNKNHKSVYGSRELIKFTKQSSNDNLLYCKYTIVVKLTSVESNIPTFNL